MARSKKQRTPAPSRSTTAGTPSTVVSPVFSTKTSVHPTPDTSDIDEDIPIRPKRNTRARVLSRNANKRPAESNGDSGNDIEGITSLLPKKRRVLTRTAYVEIPVKQAHHLEAKVMARCWLSGVKRLD
jgi:hypothetical protein